MSSSGLDDGKKMKFSQAELLGLIEQEVLSATRRSNDKLQCLTQTIQQLDRGIDFERSFETLEARIRLVTKRAEALFASTSQSEKKDSRKSQVDDDIIWVQDETRVSHRDRAELDRSDESRNISEVMESTKKALEKMRSENKVLMTAIADLQEENPPPPVLTPYYAMECENLEMLIKNEMERGNGQKTVECVKKERPCVTADPCQTSFPSVSTWKVKPATSSPPPPSSLSPEAASYNLPQKLSVHLALIKQPPSLSVLWNVEEPDPAGPPMDSYRVLIAVEKVKSSNIFPEWKTLGDIPARPLPLYALINKYKPGHKVCACVVGKDKYGRYGPYSDVVTAVVPEHV